MATLDEIKENDYNLNIPRYVDTFEEEALVDIDECMEMTCRFSKVWLAGGNIPEEMDREIKEFTGE